MVAAVNAQPQVILSPQKIALSRFSSWVQANLGVDDLIALEATSNAWEVHDRLQPQVQDVVVANTFQLKLISSSATKTDKQDALKLAKLLAANLVSGVWVPPVSVRELRRLTQHRSPVITQA